MKRLEEINKAIINKRIREPIARTGYATIDKSSLSSIDWFIERLESAEKVIEDLYAEDRAKWLKGNK